jgi:hypothetical protein
MENTINITEMTEESIKSVGSRGTWDLIGINSFVAELSQKYSGKVIGMPLLSTDDSEGFYNKFYKGNKQIKYVNFYCRKHLLDAFKHANVNADVRTARNVLLINLKINQTE